MLWGARHSQNTNNTIHARSHIYASREGSSFRPTSARCKINMNEKPHSCVVDAEKYRARWLMKMFLHAAQRVFSCVSKNEISSRLPDFLFLSLWQHGRRKYNVLMATENLFRECLSHKIYGTNFKKFVQTILWTPKVCLILKQFEIWWISNVCIYAFKSLQPN